MAQVHLGGGRHGVSGASTGTDRVVAVPARSPVSLAGALVGHHLARLRDHATPSADFRRSSSVLASLVVAEALRDLEVRARGRARRRSRPPRCELPARRVTLVPILRAGLSMLQPALDLLPDDTRVGFLGMARDEETARPLSYLESLPSDLGDDEVVVLDPMIATGGSSGAALAFLRDAGATRLHLLGLIAAPEGLATLAAADPEVRVTVAVIDQGLNERALHRPGPRGRRRPALLRVGLAPLRMPRGPAVVTGASSGLGRAYAESLAARGHPLIAVARRADRLEELAGMGARSPRGRDPDRRGRPRHRGGSRRSAGTRSTAADVPEVVVLNAGFGSSGPLWTLDRARESEMVRLNCVAVVNLAAHVLPGMVERGRGALVVMSSAAAWQPVPFMATYAATKAFELHLAEALAEELRGTGVHAIAVCPGPTRTEFSLSGGGQASTGIPFDDVDMVVRATWRALARRPQPRAHRGRRARQHAREPPAAAPRGRPDRRPHAPPADAR